MLLRLKSIASPDSSVVHVLPPLVLVFRLSGVVLPGEQVWLLVCVLCGVEEKRGKSDNRFVCRLTRSFPTERVRASRQELNVSASRAGERQERHCQGKAWAVR